MHHRDLFTLRQGVAEVWSEDYTKENADAHPRYPPKNFILLWVKVCKIDDIVKDCTYTIVVDVKSNQTRGIVLIKESLFRLLTVNKKMIGDDVY